MPTTPDVFRQFTVIKPLPAGAWGPRYLATDTRHGWKVHLHRLARVATGDPAFLNRLKADIEAASRLNDMHVVRVFGWAEDGGSLLLVTEACEGETLEGRVRREGALAPDEATAITIQIARGLDYAHRQGLAHGGLRPSKILLAGGLAKILDLGLPCPPGDGEETGAFAYRPPGRGESNPGAAADVYALGAILYHLVTGFPPACPPGASAPPDPRDRKPGVPDGTAHVIRRMMARRREDRYPDCGSLLADLERVIDGLEPAAPPIDPSRTVLAPLSTARPPKPLAAPAPVAARTKAATDDEDTRLDLPPVAGPSAAPSAPKPASPMKSVVPARPVPVTAAGPAAPAKPPAAIPKRGATAAGGPEGARPSATPPAEGDSATLEKMIDQSVRGTAERVRRAWPAVAKGSRRAVSWAGRAVGRAKERPKIAGAAAAGLALLAGIALVLPNRDPGSSKTEPSRTGAVKPASEPGPIAAAPGPRAPRMEEAVRAPSTAPVSATAGTGPTPWIPSPTLKVDFAALSGADWERAVADLPPEEQVIRVVERLRQVNPGYDGRATHAIAGGRVRGLFLIGKELRDVSPVRALAGLEQLGIGSTGVADLVPLAGLPLIELVCAGTPVKDLGPLRGMPLERLDGAGVDADLAPIGGCPLREIVCDFRPGRDAPVLRAIPGLARINGMAAADFWASADEAAAMAGATVPDGASWEKALDLLALVDPAADAVRGGWSWRGRELVSDTTDGARLELPYVPPDEYDLRVRFTRQSGAGEVVHILSREGRSLAWLMGAADNTIFGFALTRGPGAGVEPPERRMAWCLENGRSYAAEARVRRDGVSVFLNGRPVVEWKTTFSGVGPASAWALRRAGTLGLGSQSSPTIFHDARLRAVSGDGRFLRPPPGAVGEGTGLRGAYFVGKYLEGTPVFTRVDSTVDFDWDVNPPDERMPADSFSVRWTGEIQAPHTERVTFHVIADDGARLWVAGQAVVDDWNYSGRKREGSGTVELQAGRRYPIRLEYVEYRSEASVRLMWSGPSTPKAVVPMRQLYPGP